MTGYNIGPNLDTEVHKYAVKRPTENQTFDCTTFIWEVLTVHRNDFYYAVLGRDLNLSSSRQRVDALRVTPQSRVYLDLT